MLIDGDFVSLIPSMWSSEKEKRKRKTRKPSLNPSLPDDLLLSCIPRVSRLYYPTLSLVSKSFRSLLASPDLYKSRSLLGHTECCLYVCLRFEPDSNSTWFTLCRKPYHPLTNHETIKTKSSGYVLATVPVPHSTRTHCSGIVAVGSDIYNIGGSKSSTVSILDCRSHTWREAPSLRVEPISLYASVLDRKIYVAGSYKDGDCDSGSRKNFFEVFDTKHTNWDPKPIPLSETKVDFFCYKTACKGRKFNVVTWGELFSYETKEGRWDRQFDSWIYHNHHHMISVKIENVFYSAFGGAIKWYDTKARIWIHLRGLVPSITLGAPSRLADYGGKIAAFWVDVSQCNAGNKNMIWYAEIAIERR